MSMKKFGLVVGFVLILAASLPAPIKLLHSFACAPSDGFNPMDSLILVGSTLYGMTEGGTTCTGYGTIFKINPDGTGYKLLHTFAGALKDGAWPRGSLTLMGSTLVGMTMCGGSSNSSSSEGNGTIFKINTDGTGYALLHTFAGVPSDGFNPTGSLTLIGSTLYGMTSNGGTSAIGTGTVFKINKDGTGYSLLHSFTGSQSDGYNPMGSLTSGLPLLSSSVLYGMTSGTPYGHGTIFRIKTDGTEFTLLHSFTGMPSDGADPYGSLILLGSKLYGMTLWGGANHLGTIFEINTDGSGFKLLHSFAGKLDGKNPYGPLILWGSRLLGMTGLGGVSDRGIIFQIRPDGSGFKLLHSFAGAPLDGAWPYGYLISRGSAFYGMTQGGGTSNIGVIFCFH